MMKKSSVCRYFAASGDCFYGDECQFIHQTDSGGGVQFEKGLKSSPEADVIGAHFPNHQQQPQAGSNSSGRLPAESKLSSYLVSSLYGPEMNQSLSALSLEAGGGVSRRQKMLSPPTTTCPPPQFAHSFGSNGLPNNTGPSLTGNNSNTQMQSVKSVYQHPHHQGPSTLNTTQQQQQHSGASNSRPSYFIADEIRVELLRRQAILLSTSSVQAGELPDSVDIYHDLCPLEQPSMVSSTFGMVTSVFKGTDCKTGQPVCLRRVHGFQPSASSAKSLITSIEAWKKLSHANLVQLRNVFTSKAFGDSSLVFVYDYFPAAVTLMSQCFTTSGGGPGGVSSLNGMSTGPRPFSQQAPARPKLLPEAVIWTYVIQLSSALRTIHSNGLACRAFDPTKIILTSGHTDQEPASAQLQQHHPQQRLRLNSCGIFDVVAHEAFLQDLQHCAPKVLITHFQQEDLLAFGKVCLAVACNSLSAVKRENWAASLELVGKHYSGDLRSLIFYLLSAKNSTGPNGSSPSSTSTGGGGGGGNGSGGPRNINDIMPMIGARFYAQLDLAYGRSDLLEAELGKELDNGRLFRMLAKLGSVNERPELRMDPTWSETGDRYLLKLFRDYLFHQVSEDGQEPWLDMGHVIGSLNKLDVGSAEERICLASRDDQNILLVSYAELKKCYEAAFNDLLLL